MQQKKVLFTHGYFLEEDPKEKSIMRPYPPLGILYLSAYLESNCIENNVFDSNFSTFDLLKQYGDTGQAIPEKQFNLLVADNG